MATEMYLQGKTGGWVPLGQTASPPVFELVRDTLRLEHELTVPRNWRASFSFRLNRSEWRRMALRFGYGPVMKQQTRAMQAWAHRRGRRKGG